MKDIKGLMLLLLFLCMAGVSEMFAQERQNVPNAWRLDFAAIPEGWNVRANPGTPLAVFAIQTNAADGEKILSMRADKASGTLSGRLKGVDLNRTPVLRWRWRVLALPANGDGRDKNRDDQAIAIYVTTGGALSQKAIAYRWETETPIGYEGYARYGAGVVNVKWIAVRNKVDAESKEFLIEQRDVAGDFKKTYGFIPDKVFIGISCNSQYTRSLGEAQLAWVEFVPKPFDTVSLSPGK